MIKKTILQHYLFQAILTLCLFSFWAAFALLVVNRLFYKDLPGYVIGRICIWELVALIVAWLISNLMIKKWGSIQLIEYWTKQVNLGGFMLKPHQINGIHDQNHQGFLRQIMGTSFYSIFLSQLQ